MFVIIMKIEDPSSARHYLDSCIPPYVLTLSLSPVDQHSNFANSVDPDETDHLDLRCCVQM